ncbi:unnamed protein product [Paramecium octaurelia]|uniref:Uncharacterized protein n=1 Tax=Paramecium octaurelia TaxID=43137 RepID=A0A8S1Y6M5_PAROT|nr:unnamed protein product [Paramecium octaurelia]
MIQSENLNGKSVKQKPHLYIAEQVYENVMRVNLMLCNQP